ncbi:hypothetical protein JOQ06_013078 [Pogonophryne albipinna]|uniref:E3 ubiquitin-protein ligase TRIM21-like n=1 Tax=Pogonophryne albipinna TaxID=1090488 RepID=A0AAD6BKN8_9TELE|nr:hypothetical protein JOQ06_013078 [Pogonophryne albipinna]
MAAANYLTSEDQFLCSICLDVFTDPVSTSCGHNFCKTCITEHWDRKHKIHELVPLKEEYEGRSAGKTQAETQQMIQKKRLKIEEIKQSVDLSKEEADREVAEGVQVFTALKESAERGQANLINTIKEKQKTIENQAEDFIKELEQEISELEKRSSEVEQQSFSSGRFYFEVQVKGKTEWDLGVARESINRKEEIPLSPEEGYWSIWLRDGNEYRASDDPPVLLSLKSQPQKVGVFVDYEEGLVSFYDVDAAALIYSFTGCSFNGKLYPYFSPCDNDGGKNSATLIISPVRVN